MDFPEKLTALLSLTATKSITLARAVHIDAAQISRMKTGVRRIPTNPNLIRDIAAYFAGCFDSEYQLSALYELTNDVRLQMDVTEAILSKIIFDWLVSPDMTPKSHSGWISDRVGGLSTQDLNQVTAESEPKSYIFALKNTGFIAYYQNEGKRQAMRDFATYILALDSPCTIHIFTDESMDWLLEDFNFTRELEGYVKQVAQKGFKIRRIRPPDQSTESLFRSIERWFPAYMADTLKLFYYPWSRDDLHRRTMVIASGHAALHSDSLAGQKESPMTVFTTNSKTVQLMDEHFSRILERCRPMISVYTMNTAVKPVERLELFSKIEDFGIYQSDRLPVHTMPIELLARLRQRGSPWIQKICDGCERSIASRAKVLEWHTITDIICLPDLEKVIGAAEEVPGTKTPSGDCLYYKVDEYRMHLENILWYLSRYPNYQVVILDTPIFENIIMYMKGDSHALVIKENDPFVLFEVTERILASSLCEYLHHLVKDKMQMDSRESVVKRLQEELIRLEKAIT